MNFNRDLIRKIDGQQLSKNVNDIKFTAGRIIDGFAPGTSKDISKGVAAEDSMGRAAFSILSNRSQYELNKGVDELSKRLKLNDFSVKSLREACEVNGQLDNKFVTIAEEFANLGENKPDELKFVWEGSVANLVKLTKNSDGTVNNDKYEAIKELLKDDKISTRGIEDIIDASTEWLTNPQTKSWESHFNRDIFNKYKEFTPINGKSLHEQDDVFTLYIGRTLNACKKKGAFLRKGESEIIDEVALNYAKRLYEQGQDIVYMNDYLKNFHTFAQENGQPVCTGFDFTQRPNSNSAKAMLEDLTKSIGSTYWGKNYILDACKVDGELNLHNLLAADTLIHCKKLESDTSVNTIINELKNEKGLVDTAALSQLMRMPVDKIYNFHAGYVKSCMSKNGVVDAELLKDLAEEKLSHLDYTRVDGDINYDNIKFLRKMCNVPKENRFQDYQFREVFELLRNKDGVVEESLFEPLCKFKKYTHLAPKKLADCLDENKKLNPDLFNFKLEMLERNIDNYDYLWKFCRNKDNSVNSEGVAVVKKITDSNMVKLPDAASKMVDSFSTDGKIDIESVEKFIEDNKDISPNDMRDLMYSSIVNSKFDLALFNTLKEVLHKPDLKPLISSISHMDIMKLKLNPSHLYSVGLSKYHIAHIKPENIEILERNGYPARYYNMFAKGQTYMIPAKDTAVSAFNKDFIAGTKFEERIANLDLSQGVELSYSREALGQDVQEVLNSLPEEKVNELKRAFNISINDSAMEGFPRAFAEDSVPPTGIENQFNKINAAINKFMASEIKSDNPELQRAVEELTEAFPEFKMIIGKKTADGKRVDIETIKQLQNLVKSSEYSSLSQEDKIVAKMTILMKSLEQVDSKPIRVKQGFQSDNDGIAVKYSSEWAKSSEYSSYVLERYNLSNREKYRVTQLLNDLGWGEKYNTGELTAKDVAINTRFKGDEKVSPLLEKIVMGTSDIDMSAVKKESIELHRNQQLFLPTTLKELEPYIQTKIVHGRPLKYVDLDRPELRDKPILAHFTQYDNEDYSLNILRNKGYRSAWSTSIIQGGDHSSCFGGRNNGIFFETNGENIANVYHSNIDSGFGKQYNHLSSSLNSTYYKDLKDSVKDELKLSDDEYMELMSKIIHVEKLDDIEDCIINGKHLRKEDIISAHKNGIKSILKYQDQNEVTVLNPVPVGSIGIAETIDDYSITRAVSMAQENDMVMLFKRPNRK